MYKNHRIAVVVPAHNEEHHIAAVIAAMPEFVDHLIVVDDCSSDGPLAQRFLCRQEWRRASAALCDGRVGADVHWTREVVARLRVRSPVAVERSIRLARARGCDRHSTRQRSFAATTAACGSLIASRARADAVLVKRVRPQAGAL